MFTTFLMSLSDVQLLLFLPLASCLLMFLLTLLFRRFRTPLRLDDYDSDVLDTATQNTMSGAYVVLGFVLVLAMTTVSDLDNSVGREASAIRSLERLLVLDGSKSSLHSRELLLAYTRSVIQEEWPQLKHSQSSPATSDKLQKLFLSLDALTPSTPKDVALYSKALDEADKVAELRTSRILSVQSTLPGVFYLVGAVSLLGVIVICALRLIEATVIRSMALVTQIVMLTLMFSAIVIIDLPYLGDTVTSPDAMEAALTSMENRKLFTR